MSEEERMDKAEEPGEAVEEVVEAEAKELEESVELGRDIIPEDVTIRLERVYIVPLWRSWVRKRGIRRAKKAVNYLRRFVSRHMKTPDVKISEEVNRYIWRNGIRNPPRRIKVRVLLGDDQVAYVFLEKGGNEVDA